MLLRRELRRLAPLALGLGAGVPLGLLVLALLGEVLGRDGAPAPWAALLTPPAGAVLAALVLGVATVAPDSSSGALRFYERLPLSRSRLLGAKLAAGSAWLAGLSAAWLLLFRDDASSGWSLLLPGFACGALASVIVRQVTPALLLAPLLAGSFGLFLLGGTYLAGMNLAYGAMVVVLNLFSLAALGGAVLGFVHGREQAALARRALPIALATTTGACSLLVAGTEVAHAYRSERALPALPAVSAVEAGEVAAIQLAERLWYGHEQRIVLLDRAEGQLWELPQRPLHRPRLSPDGRWLLAEHPDQPGGVLVDVARREVAEVRGQRGRAGFGGAEPLWLADRPCLVEVAAEQGERYLGLHELETAIYERVSLDLPRGARLLGCAGDAVYLRSSEGVTRYDFGATAPAQVERAESWPHGLRRATSSGRERGVTQRLCWAWPEGVSETPLALGPQGRYLIASLPADPSPGAPFEVEHVLYDLERGGQRRLPLRARGRERVSSAAPARAPRYAVPSADTRAIPGFSFRFAGARLLAYQAAERSGHASDWVAWIDLPSGRLLRASEAPRAPRPVVDGALYLGPEGVSLPTQAVWTEGGIRAAGGPAPLVSVDDERFLALDRPLTLLRTQGGRGVDLGAALLAGRGRTSLAEGGAQ